MTNLPDPLASYKARFLVTKIISVLRNSIESRLKALSLGDLLALSFEVSQHVKKKVRQIEGDNHSPAFYMVRVCDHLLDKMIDAEMLRRDNIEYEKWDPGPGLNQAQILYKIQKKSRKYAEDY